MIKQQNAGTLRSSRRRAGTGRAALMLSAGTLAMVLAQPALAQVLPDNPTVAPGGDASFDYSDPGSLLVTQNSDRVLIDWDSFDIGAGGSVHFDMDAADIAVNRDNAGDPSEIYGALTGDGMIMILNPNGVLFGAGANVNVGSLVATSASLADVSSNLLSFTGAAGAVTVAAGANITVADAGLAAFVAPSVANNGIITATGGHVFLGGAEGFTLDLANDGLLELTVPTASPLVQNHGDIFAAGGRIQMSAAAASALVGAVINVEGVLQVGSASSDGGVIVLEAAGNAIEVSDDLAVEGNIDFVARRVFGAGDVDVDDGALSLNIDPDGADTTGESLIADALGVIGAVDGGTTVNLGAGDYAAGANISASNVTIDGHDAATIVVDGTPLAGLTISGDGVTVQNLAINGPVVGDHREIDWGAQVSTVGIVVNNGAENATITGNDITNLRTGIRLHGGGNNGAEVSGNYIENTKGAILVQYTDGAGLDIFGNTQGPLGNEWGIVLNLNTGTPLNQHAGTAAQANIIGLSDGNNGMTVMDRAYAWSNRSHVWVDDDSTVTPADDFDYGNGLGNERQALHTVQAGVIAVAAGGTVIVNDGTYTFTSTLNIDKSLSLIGESMDGVFFDGTAINGYGMEVNADDVTLANFTFQGNSASTNSGHYGIKVQPDTGDASDRVYDFTIQNVAIQGWGGSELDLNGVVGALIDGVIADGQGTKGVGIGLTDSADVTIVNSETLNNLWGSVALYQTNRFYDQQVDNITINAGLNSFGEALGVFAQSYSDIGLEIGDLNLTGFDFVVRNTGHRANGDEFTFFRTDLDDAADFALNIAAADTSSIEGWSGTGYTNAFTVVDGLTIGAALRDVRTGGLINVGAGTFDETVSIATGLTLEGAGMDATFITGGIATSGAISDLTLAGFSVSGVGGSNTVIRNGDVITGLTVDGVRIDGESVAGRFGFVGGQIGGDISITDSEFLNINGWAVFDTRSGAGANQGSQITSAVFSGNTLDNVQGHIAFRQDAVGAFPDVVFSNNTVTNVGNAANSFGAIFKAFNADVVTFSDNDVSDVGTSGFNPGGEAAYGAVLMVRGASQLNITGNTFTNNHMVFAVEPNRGLPTATTFTGNTFINNAYGVYMPGTALAGGSVTFGAGNNFVAGADTVQHIVWRSAGALDLTGVMFDGQLAADMSLTDQFELEDLITHGVDLSGSGLATVVDGQIFVTEGSGANAIGRSVGLAEAGDTVNLAEGGYVEADQILIDEGLSIIGHGDVVIEAGRNFTGSAPGQAWWLVEEGVTFNLSGVTLDGAGFNVAYGLRNHGHTTIDDVTFRNIVSPGYGGIAVASFGGDVAGGAGAGSWADSSLTITNSAFENIGRIGVLVKGDGATALVEDSIFTGRGEGDHVEYAIEAGASGSIEVIGNTISGYRGVAASDGSASAGILVTSYYGGASNAVIENNVISGNTNAVSVGYGGTDVSVVEAFNNDLSDNDTGVSLNSAASADFSGNWWGFVADADVADYMGGAQAGEVDFSTYLTSGADGAGAGFQGDFSVVAVTALGGQTGAGGRIQEGVNLVDTGGVVQVGAGDFGDRTITLNRSVTLQGAQAGNAGATGDGDAGTDDRGDETVLTGSGPYVFRVTAEDVTIDGFTFTGAGGRLIETSGTAHGLSITNNIFNTPSGHASNGVIYLVGTANDVLIANNLFAGNGGAGYLWLSGAAGDGLSGLTVQDNDFSGVSDRGLFQGGQQFSGFELSGNYFGSGILTGVNMGHLINPLIQGNHFDGVGYAAMQIGVIGGGTIRDNLVDGTGVTGYDFGAYSAAYGIQIWGGAYGTPSSEGLVIEGNTVLNYVGSGADDRFVGIYIGADAGPDLQVTGNTLSGNSIGLWAASAAAGLTLSDNIFTVAADGLAIRNSGSATIELMDGGNVINGVDTDTASLEELFEIEDMIDHGMDEAGYGLVRVVDGHLFVTENSGSIQRGIDAASNGDTVNVDAASYDETVTIRDSLTLTGAGQGDTVINGGIVIAGHAPAGSSIDGLTIEGLTVNAGAGQVGLIALSNSVDGVYNTTNLTVTDVTINGNGQHAVGLFDVNGATFDNVTINAATGFNGVEAIGLNGFFMDGGAIHGAVTGVNVWELSGYEANDGLVFLGVDFADNRTHLSLQGAGAVLDAILSANSFDRTIHATDGDAIYGDLAWAVGDAATGSELNLSADTFALTSALIIDRTMTLVGAGQGQTIIDASGAATYGIRVHADEVSLSDFTLSGGAGYGIKVEAAGSPTPDQRRNGFSIADVTIENTGRTGLDLNAVIGATIDGVTVTGVANGNGISITDSAGVTVRNSTTSGNAWGGLALYQRNNIGGGGSDQQLTDIVIEDSNDFGEDTSVYVQVYASALNEVGSLTVAGFDFVVQNDALDGGATSYVFFDRSLQDAIDRGVNLANASESVVGGWSGTGSDGNLYVGFGDLLGGGQAALSIQTAFDFSGDDDIIHIAGGDYGQSATLDEARTVLFDDSGVGLTGLTLTTGAAGSDLGGRVTASGDIDILGDIILNDDLSLTGAGVSLAGVDGSSVNGQTLSIEADAISLGAAGAATALNSLLLFGDATLAGAEYNAAGFMTTGSTTLATDVSIEVDGALVMGAVDGEHGLSIHAGTATLGEAGAAEALASLDVIAASITTAGATTTGGQSYIGALTLDGDYAAGGAFSVNGATTLGGDVDVDASAITLGAIDGEHALTLAADGAVSLGAVGADEALASLTASGSSVATSGAVTTGAQSYTGALTLSGDYAAGGAFTVDGATTLVGDATVDADSIALAAVDGEHGLTLNADGSVSLGAIGADEALASLAASGAAITTAGAATTGAQSYAGALTLNGDYTAGGAFSVNGATTLGGDVDVEADSIALDAVDGEHSLTLAADGAVSLGAVGADEALASLTASGASITTSGAATTGDQSYTGALTLNGASVAGGAFSVNGATTLGGDVDVDASAITLGAVDGEHDLVLAADGAINLGAIGADEALASLTASGAAITTSGANTTGTQSYAGALTLDGDYAAGGAFSVNGATTLGGDVEVDASAITLGAVDGEHDLTLAADGSISLGAVGADEALASLTASGASITTAGAATTGAQSYAGALTLDGDYAAGGAFSVNGATTLASDVQIMTHGGDVMLGLIDGAHGLTIAAGVGDVTLGPVGSAVAVDDLVVSGGVVTTAGAASTGAQSWSGDQVRLSGAFTTAGGDFTVSGPAILNGATTIATSGGDASLGSVDGATPGGQSFSLNAGSGAVDLGSLGALARLGATVVRANSTVLMGDTYAANSLSFMGAGADATVRLTELLTTFNTVQSADQAGAISIAPHLIGTVDGEQGVVFIAGTGASAGDGDITLGDAGSDDLRLGLMTASGGDFSAATVMLAGDFTSTLSGDQVFTDDTLNTLGDVNATVAGNERGPINAGGSVTLNVGGSSNGAITAGGPVIVTSGGDTNRNITSGGSVVLTSTGGSVGGSVTAQGPVTVNSAGTITGSYASDDVITLNAEQSIDVQVDGDVVQVNAPGGVVTGVFSEITTDETGTFVINGETVVGTGSADARQILIDGFIAPVGGVVGPTGLIQLPVGLALALISPAGEGAGQRPAVLVNDVDRLGELLRLGYTAIVIQMDESGLLIEEELMLADTEQQQAAGVH